MSSTSELPGVPTSLLCVGVAGYGGGMFCLGCQQLCARLLCGPCRKQLEAVAPRIVGSRLPVWSAFLHTGLARRLVHDHKYRGVAPVANLLAAAMADLLPPATAVLVPVPRVLARRIQLGIDPGVELARAISRRCHIPVVEALRAPLWRPGQAGRARAGRSPTAFGVDGAVAEAVLVDDVVTTGGTLLAAAQALGAGVIGAVTATGVCV